MPIPWPKILSAFTVPAGGWDLNFLVTVTSDYDTALSATIPAGTYFIAWDYQDDCLLFQIEDGLRRAMNAISTPSAGRYGIKAYIDTNNRVNIAFPGTRFQGSYNKVRFKTTTSTAAAVKALGFDTSADIDGSGDNPIFTATYQHAYGWYATHDGQLDSLLVEDARVTTTHQRVSPSGAVLGQQIGERYSNELRLQWLTRANTFSDGIGYTEASVHPYARNVGLECWWREAMQSKRFRVYRHASNPASSTAIDSSKAIAALTTPAWAAGALTRYTTDGAIVLQTDPEQYTGLLCALMSGSEYSGAENDFSDIQHAIDAPHRFYIASNTDDDLYSPNGVFVGPDLLADTLYVFDESYETYVVDLGRMGRFAPREHQGEDYYDIDIPLLRYEA